MTIPSVMPMVETSTGTQLVDNGCMLRLLQWVDDAADIHDDAVLVMTINGQTLTYKIQLEADKADNCVVMQIGPFAPGIFVSDILINTLQAGAIHIWFD